MFYEIWGSTQLRLQTKSFSYASWTLGILHKLLVPHLHTYRMKEEFGFQMTPPIKRSSALWKKQWQLP